MIGINFTERARIIFFTTFIVPTNPVLKLAGVLRGPEGRLFGVRSCPLTMW
jgi:hypothetical protein